MRFVSLSVKSFQCIEAADLEFGPGLNVLFGPNDLGKSSLAWAIRAVLLLQHNSAEHTRFVSWYGGDEPLVTLTLCDDDDRFWRVKKCFSKGSPGRASLESSKDGRDYRLEASARQTDDKLREMLRWGVHRPGGRGKPHGLPRSFLTQVLLSEQDDVRKILFDPPALDKEADQSGRARLTEALGALAQDPLFKQVLDHAQARRDVAFLPNGNPSKKAGAPLRVEAEKVNRLVRESEEVEERLRASREVEERFRRLLSERDELEIVEGETRRALEDAERQLAKRAARDEVERTLGVHAAALEAGKVIEERMAASQSEIADIGAELESDTMLIRAAEEDLAIADQEVVRARERLDALSQDDLVATGTRDALEEAEKSQIEAVQIARSEASGAAVSLERAIAATRALRGAADGIPAREETVGDASAASLSARERERGARAAVEAARQCVRDLTSGDRAQRLELRRAELDNQRLSVAARLAESERDGEKAREVEAIVARAVSTRAGHREQMVAVGRSRAGFEELERSRQRLRHDLGRVQALSSFAELVALREAEAGAARSSQAAEEARATAAKLRDEARALRAAIPPGLPAADVIEGVRCLRDDMRVAEARLGAVTVAVRPRRPLTLQPTRDGIAQPAQLVGEPVILSAEHHLVIAIEDLVELEVAGGDDEARATAAQLRARWQDEASPVLSALDVDIVEELLALQHRAREAERAAGEHEREAERHEERARQLDEMRVPPEPQRTAELEAELGQHDEADLQNGLAMLGRDPSSALRQRDSELAQELAECTSAMDAQRGDHARAEARLESLDNEANALEAAAEAQQAALGQAWSELAAEATAAADGARRELEVIEETLSSILQSGPAEEEGARGALAACEAELEAAEADASNCARAEQEARESLAGQLARADAARAHAKEVDARGVWSSAIEARDVDLPLEPWRTAAESARQSSEDASRRLADIRTELTRLATERAEAMAQARAAEKAADAALRSARANVDRLKEKDRESRDELAQLRQEASADQIELARLDLGSIRAEVGRLREQLATMEEPPSIDESEVSRRREAAVRLTDALEGKRNELGEARVLLEHVGGAVVRERKADLERAIEHAKLEERRVHVVYEGWKLLVETLREAESAESAHLGRALAQPVSQRFRQLTGGRYGGLELGADLEAKGLHAAGDVRPIGELSAGTQDQLATLFRLCIAEQLQSCIVLDDHLSQSDPARVAWFKERLLEAAQQVQILLITCRPLEILRPDEVPEGVPARSSAAGLVRAIDLTRVIRRFASDRPAMARGPSDDAGTSPELTTS